MSTIQPYGVLYNANPNRTAPAKTIDELLTPDIKFVRVQWNDYINTPRCRILPADYFRKLLSNPASRPGVGVVKAALGIVGLSIGPGFSPVGEYLYVPDLSSWRVCTYAPGHASVMGWFQEKTPTPSGELSVPLCPRTILQRIVRCARVFTAH